MRQQSDKMRHQSDVPPPQGARAREAAALAAAIASFPAPGRTALAAELAVLLNLLPHGTPETGMLRAAQAILDEARATRH